MQETRLDKFQTSNQFIKSSFILYVTSKKFTYSPICSKMYTIKKTKFELKGGNSYGNTKSSFKTIS